MTVFRLLNLVSIFFVSIAVTSRASSAGSTVCGRSYSQDTATQSEYLKKFESVLRRNQRTLPALPEAARPILFRSLRNHLVASLERLNSYDPQGLIGFCFGRSMAAFLLASEKGVSVTAIKNLFIVGDLRSGAKPEWRFHVTSVIQLSNGAWYAFDPVVPQNRPIPVAEWVKTVRSIWDKKGQAKLYVTSPFHIIPDIRNMAEPIKETGKDIIDLSFDPLTKGDIQLGHSLGASLKTVTYFEIADNGYPYFLQVHPDKSATFGFDNLSVNGMKISFNNYFYDLIDSIYNPDWKPPPTIQGLSVYGPSMIDPSNFGMKINDDFWQMIREARP